MNYGEDSINGNISGNINNPMIDDDQNGTPVHAVRKHLDNIGYVPQQMNQMQQIQQIQQIQQMRAAEQMQQMLSRCENTRQNSSRLPWNLINSKLNSDPSNMGLQQQQGVQQVRRQQQIQQMQHMNQMDQVQQVQQMKRNKKNIPDDITRTESTDHHHPSKQADITHLVSDINKSLDNYSPSNQDIPPNDDPVEEEANENYSRSTYLPDWLKEPLLILIIYVLLSQNFVKTFTGKHIKYINPGDDGTVPFLGVVIYGTILAVLYIILKRLFI